MTAFFGPVSSYFEGCIGERCFTISGSNETRNFNDAKTWCNERNSNLVAVNDGTTQEALTQFLNSARLNEQPKSSTFIDLQLQKKARSWYLVNGTEYLGKTDFILHLKRLSIELCFTYLHKQAHNLKHPLLFSSNDIMLFQ